MGSGDWFKTIISRKKKVKIGKSNQSKGSSATEKPTVSKSKDDCQKANSNGGKVTSRTNGARSKPSEDVAATMIQTAFRAYMARKALRRMKGEIRFQKLTQVKSVRKQATSTLTHLHTWSRIQSQIRDRRLSMVTEGRLNQKKLENQMKLEAKLHDVEVEWNGGPDTMQEILARIHHREEAAVKRERALAYAFSHQWRANSNQNQGPNASELGKANWGWSWKERWIVARPWESRVPSKTISPKKGHKRPTSKFGKSKNTLTTQKEVPIKSGLVIGKVPGNARRLSFPGAEKPTEQESNKEAQEATVKKRQSVS